MSSTSLLEHSYIEESSRLDGNSMTESTGHNRSQESIQFHDVFFATRSSTTTNRAGTSSKSSKFTLRAALSNITNRQQQQHSVQQQQMQQIQQQQLIQLQQLQQQQQQQQLNVLFGCVHFVHFLVPRPVPPVSRFRLER